VAADDARVRKAALFVQRLRRPCGIIILFRGGGLLAAILLWPVG